MSTSDFDKYKVDHLFLLMGENPLPNYVAARLLLNKEGTPHLVHTTGTAVQAERLKRILDLDDKGLAFKNAQLTSLNDYEADAYHIQDEIRRKVESLKGGRLGMNYTGGTKAMAVHAYRALFNQRRPDTVFSYLDPRRLEMCIDREDGDRIHKKVSLEVELAKVFQLHGLVWQSEPTYEPELPEAARAFAEFHMDKDAATAWRNWCNDVLRKSTRDDKGRWLRENKLKNVPPLSLESLKPHENILNALEHLGASTEELPLQTVKDKGLEKLEHTCKWLDGEWLEHYVLQQVKGIAKEWSIHDSATSFWISDPNNPREIKFQIAPLRMSYQKKSPQKE